MTPLAMQRAAEDIADDVNTDFEARQRGDALGKIVADQIHQRGMMKHLKHGFHILDLELTLLHIASSRKLLLAVVASSALKSLRRERNLAQLKYQAKFAINSVQCRQARELLGWYQRNLAGKSRVSLTYVNQFERLGTIPGTSELQRERVRAFREAFEAAGVVFVIDGKPILQLREHVVDRHSDQNSLRQKLIRANPD